MTESGTMTLPPRAPASFLARTNNSFCNRSADLSMVAISSLDRAVTRPTLSQALTPDGSRTVTFSPSDVSETQVQEANDRLVSVSKESIR